MLASRRVACVLALHRVRGYDKVRKYLESHRPDDVARWEEKLICTDPLGKTKNARLRALECLCLLADNDIVPKLPRKAASHCGGLEVGEGQSHPHPHDDQGSSNAMDGGRRQSIPNMDGPLIRATPPTPRAHMAGALA